MAKLKTFNKSDKRADLDAEVELYREVGVDTPDDDSDELSNKGKVVDWLEGAVEEHGYAIRITKDFLQDNPELQKENLEIGSVALIAEEDEPEEAEESDEEPESDESEEDDAEPEASEADSEEEDEDTEEESDDEEEAEESEDSDDSEEAEEEDEPESMSIELEDGESVSYEGTIDGKEVVRTGTAIIGGRSYVEFELEDGSIQKLSREEIKEHTHLVEIDNEE